MVERNTSLIITFGLLLRCLVALHGYSGEGKSPMFGDYEAQRHWMEVTYNLPIKDWYFNAHGNNLNYWGLDYPPLTAYHSWLCGYIASYLNPKYVELYNSYGYESPDHKFFMRSTVLIADIITFIYATYVFCKTSSRQEVINLSAFIMLTYPGLILIDHGHFQYNCVSLGLALFAIVNLLKDNDILACIFFCLALSYKQMLLYFSLPIFFYFLGKCVKHLRYRGVLCGTIMLFKIACSVILTFAIVWYPFIFDKKQLLQVINRIFPLARGVFEDKVSNVWCVLNLFYKFKIHLSNDKMAVLCAITTFISVSPSCYDILMSTRKDKLIYGLFNSALGFFLFSFQVHEKSILIVALAAMLCFKYEPLHSIWFLILSTFSMLPLLIKDKLVIPSLSLSVFYVVSISSIASIIYANSSYKTVYFKIKVIYTSLAGCCLLTFLTLSFNPPSKYPDLFSVFIATYSALHYIYFLIYFNYKQLKIGKQKIT